MRNIQADHPIQIEGVLNRQNVQDCTIVDISIGHDDKIYILLSERVPDRIRGMFVDTQANTGYYVIVMNVNWHTGELLSEECYHLGIHLMNFHFVQPIGDEILLLGSRARYGEPEPEKNAVIVAKTGKVICSMCLGDGIERCIVTKDEKIITSYFDEGVFGNYGWDIPIGSCGLIVWDRNGNRLWENKHYNIYDCYALNVDDRENLWFCYYDAFVLVKLSGADYREEAVYHPEYNGISWFGITKDERFLVMDGGYNKHSEFWSARIVEDRLEEYEKTDILYQGKALLLKSYYFRGSKAVFWDNDNRLFAVELYTMF